MYKYVLYVNVDTGECEAWKDGVVQIPTSIHGTIDECRKKMNGPYRIVYEGKRLIKKEEV